MPGLTEVAENALRKLAAAAEAGRLVPPYDGARLRGLVARDEEAAAREGLEALQRTGFTQPQLALHLQALAAERAAARNAAPAELVWSGPVASPMRDTGVVLRGLFAGAESSVLVAGFAFAEGPAIFASLAARMDERPDLDVKICLNVPRKHDDQRPDAAVLGAFAQDFYKRQWPFARRPAVFYDPRSLVLGPKRAVLHAKCVVADDMRVFVTSANFTEAAQERNIEVGVLLESQPLARRLRGQFEQLVSAGLLHPLGHGG